MKTNLICPKCGAEFQIEAHETIVMGRTIAEDSNLGTIKMPLKGKSKTQERLDILKAAGVDTSKFFAMGDKLISIDKNTGTAKEVDDDDPIVKAIYDGGTIRNAHLFKQHVMAQVLRNMLHGPYFFDRNVKKDEHGYAFGAQFSRRIDRFSYEYSWQVVNDMLTRQSAMWLKRNYREYAQDNQFYNKNLVLNMLKDYRCKLIRLIRSARRYKCNHHEYVKFCNYGELVKFGGYKLESNPKYGLLMKGEDYNNVLKSINKMIELVENAATPRDLHHAVEKWVSIMPKLFVYREPKPYCAKLSKDFIDAYKGYGAYYTMQNMILFHNCFMAGVRVEDRFETPTLLNKEESLLRLDDMVSNGAKGFELLGALKQFINYNHFDIEAKFAEWRAKYNK